MLKAQGLLRCGILIRVMTEMGHEETNRPPQSKVCFSLGEQTSARLGYNAGVPTGTLGDLAGTPDSSWPFTKGEWIPVPAEVIIKGPNRNGTPVAWWYFEDGKLHIRCYAPGGGV